MMTRNHPVMVTIVIMLIAFALGHIIPSWTYKSGMIMTIIGGFGFIGLIFLFLRLGFKAVSPQWANIYGLCAGISGWIFYGEILETLQDKFGVTTGVEINYGNIPVLLVLGLLLWIIIFRRRSISDPTVLQFINAFYIIWSLHVVLLTIYYAPVFGGEIVEHGVKVSALKVWSPNRIIAAFVVEFAYLLIFVPLIIVKVRRTNSVELKTAAGFWLVILFWSIVVEIPNKLF